MRKLTDKRYCNQFAKKVYSLPLCLQHLSRHHGATEW